MFKSDKNKEVMLETMEQIIETVKPLVESSVKFLNEVDEISSKETGLPLLTVEPDLILKFNCTDLCMDIINSRLSIEDKQTILLKISDLISIVERGGYLQGLEYANLWDTSVRKRADERIEEIKARLNEK